MLTKRAIDLSTRVAAASMLAMAAGAAAAQGAPPNGFSFQGELEQDGAPVDGLLDLQFALFDTPFGGQPVGTVNRPDVPIEDGIFSVILDFGPAELFKDGACWLETRVLEDVDGDGDLDTLVLDPRRPILSTPKALVAECAEGAADTFTVFGRNATIRFGPNIENQFCFFGLNVNFNGLVVSDIFGLRLLNPIDAAVCLFFGESDLCKIFVDPSFLPGLVLQDPNCIRIFNPLFGPAKLVFGETDLCSVFLDPEILGLTLSDPNCVRVTNPLGGTSKLVIGPDPLCSVFVNPDDGFGLTLSDPNCVRVVNPVGGPAKIVFGPEGTCSIGVLPQFPGLSEVDPVGFRLLDPSFEGGRLLFGPTDTCTIEILPNGPRGLLLRDPIVRVLPPSLDLPPVLAFGPTDDCRIEAGPIEDPLAPLKLCDPRGIALNTSNVFVGLEPAGSREFALEVQGAVAAAEFVQFSSAKFKRNVEDLPHAIELIEQLRGVSFDWEGMNDGRHDVGFIAEEVAEVLPELVQDINGEPAGIAYHRLTAVTVEAIKAQQREIEAITAERDELRHRLDRLEAAVSALLEEGGR